jgi:uncharacterized oxidoreductase
MITIPAPELQQTVASILRAAGCLDEVANRVAASLVESNVVGHDSHGVMRVPFYIDAIRAGTLDPTGRVTVVQETPATTFLDCGWNFGQYACAQGMQMAIDKSRVAGIGLTVLRHCDHTGRIGEYVVMAAEQGCIGQVVCNGSIPGGLVAPFGGRARALGANPIAWGLPGQPPVYLDFATSAAAHGKLEVAADKGELVPEGWILDKHGRPTRDPHDEMDGGVILPFGGHKGYALGVMIELVGGGLSGAGFPIQDGYRWDQGTLLIAINIASFQPLEAFQAQVEDFRARIKNVPLAQGHDEIFVPGELEWRTRERRLQEGIPLPEVSWGRIREAAHSLGLAL